MSSKGKKQPQKDSFLYKKWIEFISPFGFSLTKNLTHDRLKATLNKKDGDSFRDAYRKLSSDIFGDSSLIRMRLMIFVCYHAKLFTPRFERDLDEYIKPFKDPNNTTRLFFEKYCTVPKDLCESGILKLANDLSNMSLDEFLKIQQQGSVMVIPPFIVAFLTFIDPDQYANLPLEQQTLFDIITNHDIKGDSTFIDLDLAIEGSNLNNVIVNYFLTLHRMENEGKNIDEVADIFTTITVHSTNMRRLLLMNITKDEKDIKSIQETSNNLVKSLYRMGKRFAGDEDGPECTEDEMRLFKRMTKRIELLKQSEEMKNKNLINPILSMYNIMFGKIGTSWLDATVLLMRLDKEAGLSFLFSVYTGIDSVCDWWTVNEGVNKSLEKILPLLNETREKAKETVVSASSSSGLL